MESESPIKKKRGRKPKTIINNSVIPVKKLDTINESIENINTEDENIILHLPITNDDINKITYNNNSSIFIKSEDQLDKSIIVDSIQNTETTDTNKNIFTNNVNKIITHKLKITNNTKCWWDRNSFTTVAVQLPEDYYNETFYCIGHFCSFNCAKSYNLSLNDSNVWKRETLINQLYFMTFGNRIEIKNAPHWIVLEEYGGNLSIDKFRDNFVISTKEYLILQPPLITREMQIEESYKINKLKEVSIDKINKIYSELDTEYSIKRSKPIYSSRLNLETTGLIKVKKY